MTIRQFTWAAAIGAALALAPQAPAQVLTYEFRDHTTNLPYNAANPLILPTVGSTNPSVTRAARSAAFTASSRSADTRAGLPPPALIAVSSLSSRKRLAARSMASISAPRMALARWPVAGSVSTRDAVVPSAGKVDR